MPEPTPDPVGFEWRHDRVIPWSELRFEQSIGGGPGGQHVNKTATRVTLIWSPATSSAFADHEVRKICTNLRTRINSAGELRLRSGANRSARRNRDECLSLMSQLLKEALTTQRRRVATKPTRSSKKRRVDQKRRRSDVKKNRKRPGRDD